MVTTRSGSAAPEPPPGRHRSIRDVRQARRERAAEESQAPNKETQEKTEDARKEKVGTDQLTSRMLEAIHGQEQTAEYYRGIIKEALEVIREGQTIQEVVQEVRGLKVMMEKETGNKTWAQTAATTRTQTTNRNPTPKITIQLQSQEEKDHINQLSSQEIVQKMDHQDILGVKKGVQGRLHLILPSQEAKERLEKSREWTHKVGESARVVLPRYQLLVHGSPLGEAIEDIPRKINNANNRLIPGLGAQRAAWLNKKPTEGKKAAGSVILWTERAEAANQAIERGLKEAERFGGRWIAF